jgi:ABC-type transport system involved in multi-copper enzyme maturation permease subunit
VPIIAGYALQEALRRRIFHVVLLLTAVYLGLFWLGADTAFEEVAEFEDGGPVEEKELTGGTLFGLSMFGTLFLGAVLAAFLTLGVVRGDAERGLLQPLVVRPVGRGALLLGRFLGAAAVCVPYVLAVYTACALITRTTGDWWPDQFLRPGVQLAAGVLVIAALGLLGSVFLSATANGIAIFMVFGAGLVAGLLGQIGEAINSETLQTVADRTSWALPFEALYQDALYRITSESRGFTGLAIELGPFGGSQAGGTKLVLWAIVYFAVVLAATLAAFSRRDL